MLHLLFHVRAWIAAAALFVLSMASASGQQSIESGQDGAQGAATSMVFSDGVTAVQEGNQQQAAQLLLQVMLDEPDYLDEEQGSAAYWLGQTYAADGNIDRAIQIWRLGILALHEADEFEVRLADTYIRHVFRHQSKANYELATEAYARMLQHLDASLAGQDAAVLSRHLATLRLVLPGDVERKAGITKTRIKNYNLSAVTSEPIIAWWRSQDPLPATLENERMVEHLERIAHAREHYASSARPTGLDDRGEIYVRYGAPQHKEVVEFNETRLTDEIFRPGLSVNLSDFPMNEFWSYTDIDRSGYYVFVEGDEGYRIGRFDELLPRPLRSGYSSSSERGRRRSYLALSAMRAIYRRVSPYHPDLALRHDEIANYLAQVTDVGVSSRNEIDTRQSLNSQIRSGAAFAGKTMRENRNRDEIAARTRQRSMPEQSTRVFQGKEELGIAVRTARFLDDDGTTRTEIYWSPFPDAMRLNDDQRDELEEQGHDRFNQFIVRLTAAQKDASYQSRVLNRKHYRIGDIETYDGSTIPAQTLQIRGDTALHHLALQWDQYLVARDAQGDAQLGPRVKVTTSRRDSVEALISDERILQMSDLRAMVIPPEAPTPSVQQAIPYPFPDLSPDLTPVLYFEIYHLALASDDRARYSVEYTVQRRANDGRLIRFFTGDEPPSTSAETTYEGQRRTAKEYIMLDLSEWNGEDGLTVTVQVTDEATGQQVQRSIDFDAAR